VVRVSALARLLVISQAPGTKVHASGLPFDDASGDRLRGWMGIDRDTFYDITKLAFMPMGFCYPGRLAQGGDAPPRPECAPLWHEALLAQMPRIELILLVGGYAQRRYLGAGNVTETVRGQNRGGRFLALPHPSWRTGGWERRNPWFGAEILPWLKTEVARLTGPG
jgi:uracil-DNA glycosylase